ncbi:general substrate transporter [Mrakia frigida]|uniref:general substrate transporter n=1 Tax=Mrakia frigida TaxID=29902 RepID=UPI003FCC09B3
MAPPSPTTTDGSSLPSETWQSKANGTNSSWWLDRGLRRLNIWILWTFLSAITLGYDGSLLNGLQALSQWNDYFNTPSGVLLGLMTAAQSFGAIPGGPLGAYLGDRYGRKSPILWGSVFCIAGVLFQTFSVTVNQFIGSRVLIGIGSGIQFGQASVLATELCHVRYRGPAVTLFNSTYYVGSMIAAWVTYGTLHMTGNWAWRLPVFLQAVSSILVLVFFYPAPESPRWLVSRGRNEEALELLARYHSNGDELDELVQFEFEEIKEAILSEQASRSTTWTHLYETPGNRKRLSLCILIGAASQLNGVGIITYYLAPILRTVGITSPGQIAGLNGGLSVFNWFAAIGGSLLVDRVGRRPLWLTSTSGMLATLSIITALSATFAKNGNASVGNAVVAFLFFFFGFYDLAYTGLTISYPSEILPFNIRSKGLAVVVTTAFVALSINQLVNPIALEAIGWKYYFVYIGILAFLLVAQYLWYPETRGYTLEEIAVVFDSPPRAHAEESIPNLSHVNTTTPEERKHEVEHIEDSSSKS